VGPEHVDALVEAVVGGPGAYRWNTMPRSRRGDGVLRRRRRRRWREGDGLTFATVRQVDDRVVGCTRFTRAEYWSWADDKPFRRTDGTPDVVDIGYTWLAASAQRTGINVEAKRLMLAHAFDTWAVHRVSLDTDVRNHQSRQAIEALGARFEGVVRAERIGVRRNRAGLGPVLDHRLRVARRPGPPRPPPGRLVPPQRLTPLPRAPHDFPTSPSNLA
jgi:RimJ/RimL family protein N-acetyltransferase